MTKEEPSKTEPRYARALLVPERDQEFVEEDPRYNSRGSDLARDGGVPEVTETGDELEECEIDIPEDAYGAGILAIVRDFAIVRQGSLKDEEVQLKMVQGSFALLLLALNLAMQFSLLGFIYLYVVGPSVQTVQHAYADFHENVFDSDGNFLSDEWDAYDSEDQLKLCSIGMSSPFFYSLVVFLWVLLIINEFRTSERLMRDLLGMPNCSSITEMCVEQDDKVQVVALTPGTKVLLVCLVCIPKIIICSILMWLGCQWLTATNSFSDLVMNSIAMEFVTKIDENLYDTLLPATHRKQVSDINFVVKKKVTASRTKEFQAFGRSFTYLVLAIAFVLGYRNYVQTVLPSNLSDLKELCTPIVSAQEKSLCNAPFWDGAFGLDSCFPYGRSTAPSDQDI
eukprot:gb/GFBE01023237.1/.p1 GENE.gb/GFBE01023237.1/~~gb/GFBE01023237.1/.p1  ORF type:complete len:396 (+),score=84.04 gb/GFBE01023237.1/:1-1188(+)